MKNNPFDSTIKHCNYQNALMDLYSYMLIAEPGEMIVLTGPSRAGKSKVVSDVLEIMCQNDKNDREHGRITPAIRVNASNTGRHGSFDTKEFVFRMLDQMGHVFYSATGPRKNDTQFLIDKYRATSETGMRIALERALIARGVRFIIIDEAQHAAYVSQHAAGGYRVLDSWKTLASDTGTVLIVVGAYPVLDILNRSPHMLGRKHQVHLPRYRLDAQDIKEFTKIVARYESLMEGVPRGFLKENVRDLHSNSLGCIGLLRAWLARFYATSVVREDGVISKENLMKLRIEKSSLQQIEQEIAQGELLLGGGGLDSSADAGRAAISGGHAKSTSGRPFQKKPRRIKKGSRS